MTLTGRLSGINVPLFSLRSASDAGVGDFASLDGLFEYMQLAGQRLLMVLPMLPLAPGESSPYGPRSAFGFNPLFIHLGWLPEGVSFSGEEQAAIDEARAARGVRYDVVPRLKFQALERAFTTFDAQGPTARSREFEQWCLDNLGWLEPYALYASLSEAFQMKPWWEWPAGLARRDAKSLEVARHEHRRRVRFHMWLQWVAESQWTKVRAQARARGIVLVGDEPFIISSDSADCWWWPRYLRRDARLGVPPDDFSAEGQDWGLPWFDFEAMERDGDTWLLARGRKAAATFDARRVDHAVGYFRQYLRDEQQPRGRFVPATEPAQQARGERNFKLLAQGGQVVAEDLGVIPRFVRDTLARLQLPGYNVMRWAREDGVYKDPRHYPELSLVTTGTHDTDTLKSFWETAEHWEREAMCRTFPELWRFQPPPTGFSHELHEGLLRAALNSQSRWCLFPWQDLFGETERVNLPGTVGDHNWTYRIAVEVEQLPVREDTRRVAEWLARLTRESRRT